MPSPIFPDVDIPSLASVSLPKVYRVHLDQPTAAAISDLPGAVQEVLSATEAFDPLPAGSEVAIAVGSRGIANLPALVGSVVGALRSRGLEPFIVPAMGSHGGGTAEGQAAVLAKLGVTASCVGAEIRASMEVVELGVTRFGVPAYFDAHAANAKAVVMIARVKSHTSFDRDIESGLTKMVAIGLGKQEGARNVHRLGPAGMRDVLPEVAAMAAERSPLVCGLAVVENAAHETIHVECVPANAFAEADRRLLKMAKSLLARLPFKQVDSLICQELGKEISGAGMDYGVIGRTDIRGIPNPDHIAISKLAILRLTAATAGNGVGVGVADFMPRETANQLNLKSMYENAITAAMGEKVRIPIVLPTEQDVVRATVATDWAIDNDARRYCQIRNTLALDEVLVSDALWQELGKPASDGAQRLQFDDAGRLQTLV